jgi:tetratricopeptide (TPR) repeat protein
VTYGSLVQERKRALHSAIVEAIETQADDRIDEQIDRLAYHAYQGRVWEKAVTYLRQAAQKAMSRSIYQEAVRFLEEALVGLGHIPETQKTLEQGIDLRFDLRSSLQAFGEHERVFDHLREAEALASALGDQDRLGWASAYLSQYLWWMDDPAQADMLGQRAQTIASAQGDFPLQVTAGFFLGQGSFNVGDYENGIDRLQRTIGSLQGERAYERLGLTGLPSVLSRVWLAWSLAERGEFSEALRHGEEALLIAETADQPYSIASAFLAIGQVHLVQGALTQAIPVFERGAELCKTWDLRVIFPMNAAGLGLALALRGRLTEALPILEEGEAQAPPIRIFDTSSAATALGTGYLLAGRMDEASRISSNVLDLAVNRGFRGNQARAKQLLGNISARRFPPEAAQAEGHYRGALALASELGMRPLIAHCRKGLGALYGRTGREEKGREELTTAMDMYRDMEMTFWLEKAEAELTEIA